MTEVIRCTPGALEGLITRRMKRLEERANKAKDRTAQAAVPIIRGKTPKAFGELISSVHAVLGGLVTKTVVDAPHAAAVEVGSAPHTPNLDALVEWVKLRGLQGLSNLRSSRLHGPTTRDQAVTVKRMLRNEVVWRRGPRGGKLQGGQYSPIDSPLQVAKAIAKGIEVNGTPPHFYVRDSLPEIRIDLDKRMRNAIKYSR